MAKDIFILMGGMESWLPDITSPTQNFLCHHKIQPGTTVGFIPSHTLNNPYPSFYQSTSCHCHLKTSSPTLPYFPEFWNQFPLPIPQSMTSQLFFLCILALPGPLLPFFFLPQSSPLPLSSPPVISYEDAGKNVHI